MHDCIHTKWPALIVLVAGGASSLCATAWAAAGAPFPTFEIGERRVLVLRGQPGLRSDLAYASFTGDLGFRYGDSLPGDLEPLLGADAALLPGFSLRVVNLESLYSGQPRVDDLTDRVVSRLGFDVVSLANNHALDGGQERLENTIDRLQAAGVRVIGTPDHPFHEWTAAGRRIAVYALAHYTDQKPDPYEPGSGVLTIQPGVIADLARMTVPYDLRIAFLHLGSLSSYPSPHEEALVQQVVAAGADLVICTGSHFVKGFMEVDGKPVLYGTGNYLFSWKGINTEPVGMHAVVGIGAAGIEQLFVIPFGADWVRGPFGPLDDAGFGAFAAALATRSDPGSGDYFSDDRTAELAWNTLKTLSLEQFRNLRPRHFAYAIRIAFARHPVVASAAALASLTLVVWIAYLIRRRRSPGR